MMRLLRAELGRARSRFLVWIVAVGSLVIAGILTFSAYDASRPPSDTEIAQQTRFFEESLADWEENHEEYYADCLEQEAATADATGDVSPEMFDCDSHNERPVLEDWFYNTQFSELAETGLGGYAQFLMGGAFLLGASLLAAEIATGSMGTWLTFAPRRGAVLASKLTAVGITSLIFAVLMSAALVAGLAGATAINGALDATPELWGDVALLGVRGVALIVVAGLAGASLGALLRHTAAALGVALGYVIVGEGLLASLVPSMQPWVVLVNVRAVLEGSVTVFWSKCTTNAVDGTQNCVDITRTVTLADGSLYLGVLTTITLLLTWLVFRKRDVS